MRFGERNGGDVEIGVMVMLVDGEYNLAVTRRKGR